MDSAITTLDKKVCEGLVWLYAVLRLRLRLRLAPIPIPVPGPGRDPNPMTLPEDDPHTSLHPMRIPAAPVQCLPRVSSLSLSFHLSPAALLQPANRHAVYQPLSFLCHLILYQSALSSFLTLTLTLEATLHGGVAGVLARKQVAAYSQAPSPNIHTHNPPLITPSQ